MGPPIRYGQAICHQVDPEVETPARPQESEAIENHSELTEKYQSAKAMVRELEKLLKREDLYANQELMVQYQTLKESITELEGTLAFKNQHR